MPDFDALADALTQAGLRPTGRPHGVSGGDISAAWRVETAEGPAFVKSGPATSLPMFTAERDALLEIGNAGEVRVPRPFVADRVGDTAFVALEWLDLEPPGEAQASAFGTALAALHRHTSDAFGWQRDNTIGLTPQINTRSDDWIEFWRERRLRPQFDLAAENGFGADLRDDGDWLCDRFAILFADYRPAPSLLHGDLWGGNWAAADGEPVMFDPATYYGDREAELAMTHLFGGFSAGFYRAYEEAWPLADGADARLPLYQLYHVLNHLNLFGRGYLGRAKSLIDELRRSIDAA